MNNLPNGMYIAKNSPVHRMDAVVKIISFAVLVAAVVLTNSLYGYIAMFLFAAAVCAVSKIGIKASFGNIIRLRWFFLVIFLMNLCFFSAENAWISWWVFTPSYAGLMQGIKVAARVIVFLIFSNVVTATTPPAVFTAAIESLLSPLKIVKVPVRQIALIISVSVQFIPILFEETDTIRKAQTARGAQFESRNLFKKAQAVLPMVVPIFVSAFRRADELSIAMEARGYRTDNGFGTKQHIHIGAAESIAFVLCCAMLALQIAVF